MNIEPRPRRVLPLADEQRAAAADAAARFRAEAAARRSAELPLRETLLAALAGAGVPLADLAAAAGCPCSCHPRVNLELHDGGASCSCQLSEEEAAARRTAAFERLGELQAELSAGEREHRAAVRAALAARAAELGAERVRIASEMVPFVLTGRVDGRGFYLRSRHEEFRVTVAADGDPGADPWSADPAVLTFDVAEGPDTVLEVDGVFSSVRALEAAVAAVRSFHRTRVCAHPRAVAGDRFCADCGAALIPAELP